MPFQVLTRWHSCFLALVKRSDCLFPGWSIKTIRPYIEPDFVCQVKVLYVRNLTQEITEEALKEQFERFGAVERVKKIKDYAFVHFEERDCAVKVST